MKIKNILILMCCLTYMQSYSAASAQSQMDLSRLPRDVLVETVIQGINQAGSLHEAWEFIQKLSLANSAFANLIKGDTPGVTALVAALSEQVKKIEDPTKKLFDLVKTEKIGDVAAKIVMRALLKTADKDWQDKKGRTALMEAARRGLEGIVRELINARADVNKQDKERSTALMIAALYRQEGVVKELIKAGADVNKQNKYGETALFEAARRGLEGMVKDLTKAGADVNKQTQYGETALFEAARRGLEEMVKDLIKAGADVNKQTQSGRTALFEAAQYGREGVVRELIKAGADVNKRNEEGWTALWWAVIWNRQGVVRELIKAGINVNKQGKDGGTVLMEAVHRGHEGIVRKLIDAGANPLIRDKYGKTALDLTEKASVRQILQEAMVFELINEVAKDPLKIKELKELMQKVTMNITDTDGDTPLHKAVKKGNTELVGLILRAQPLLAGKKNNAGFTPIEWAIAHNQWVILDLFTKLTEPSEESLFRKGLKS